MVKIATEIDESSSRDIGQLTAETLSRSRELHSLPLTHASEKHFCSANVSGPWSSLWRIASVL